ncbi:MAG: hypothetical protein CL661_01340 [Bacteroidetes bacterium]|jgi:hypothetical protein|nr:hypothetical protein [Bacteroidota bacterium]
MNYNDQMGVKPIFIILVDISGYTNFIRLHKMSLLHAEKIIGELMESILDEVESPVVAHEILGDAISLYALDDGSPDIANKIYRQLEKYFLAFHEREAYLLRECGYCICDACNKVRELKIKAILHSGEAVFTKVRDIQKISGEDVITAHRLLKNSIASDEYILITNSFLDRCESFDETDFEKHGEHYEGLGTVNGIVRNFETVEAVPDAVSSWRKFKFLMKIERHMFARLFGKVKLEFRNLPLQDSSA